MSKKIATIITATAVAVSAVAGTAFAARSMAYEAGASESTQPAKATLADATIGTTSLLDQTVYVFTDASGKYQKSINSDWLKAANGEDLYQKSDTSEQAPLSLKVTYTLDGKEISAKDLAGKSGRVTARYAFINNQLDGAYHVPYLVLSGLVLPNDHFSNVEVINGKLLNDGSRSIVAGVTLPGLQQDLGLDASQLELPSYFEFSADVQDFQLGISMSLATSAIFAEVNTDNFNLLSSLSGQINQLTSAMTQLTDGSAKLQAGLETLYSKVTGELASGIAELQQGAAKLTAGTEQLSSQLATGSTTLAESSTAIIAGYDQIITKIFASVNAASGLNVTMENYAQYHDTLAAVPTLAGTVQIVDGLITYRSYLVACTSGVEEKVAAAATGAAQLDAGAKQLQGGLDQLAAAAPELTQGIAQLKDGAGQLATGLDTFNAQAVQKLVSLYQNDLLGLQSRVQSIVQTAKRHNNVKYLYRTAEIK